MEEMLTEVCGNSELAAQYAGMLHCKTCIPCHFWTFPLHHGDPQIIIDRIGERAFYVLKQYGFIETCGVLDGTKITVIKEEPKKIEEPVAVPAKEEAPAPAKEKEIKKSGFFGKIFGKK